MYRSLFAGLALLFIEGSFGSSSWLELNPELGKYQDESQCFPLAETWHTLYRNYEYDPILGGTVKCIRHVENGPEVNGAFPITFKFGNQTVNELIYLESSDGYTAKNVLEVRPAGGTDSKFMYVAYQDCQKCVILRNVYIDDSACVLLVPTPELDHHSTCCDFIFDLLCGVGQKYYMYDDSCKAGD